IAAQQEAAVRDAWTVLDGREAAPVREEAARRLNVVLGDRRTATFVGGTLAARALSAAQSATLPSAVAQAANADETELSALLQLLQKHQPQIARVCAAFDQLPPALFGEGEPDRERWRAVLVEEGAFRALAFASSEQTSVARVAADLLTWNGVTPDPRR